MLSAADAYRVLAPAVLGYLRAEHAPDPEDLLGETFLQVARDLRRFKGDEDELRRWVFTIARHRLIDERRRRSRRPHVVDERPPDLAAPPPDESLDACLIAALECLSADQREIILLRFVADLPLRSVAAMTGRSAGAVKALQHRGLERLRILLHPQDAY
jgi:RNA polymerase sigma factor (sigma-70 family)